MNTILTRGCKRCNGDLFLEREFDGTWSFHCLQGGHDFPLKPVPVLKYVNQNSFIIKSNNTVWRTRPSLSSVLRPTKKIGYKHPNPIGLKGYYHSLQGKD